MSIYIEVLKTHTDGSTETVKQYPIFKYAEAHRFMFQRKNHSLDFWQHKNGITTKISAPNFFIVISDLFGKKTITKSFYFIRQSNAQKKFNALKRNSYRIKLVATKNLMFDKEIESYNLI